ncbi:MAG: hypothetical protein ACRCU1_14070, partial [Alsobacter sp.]
MLGEGAGLFIGAGEGITGLGSMAEAGVAARAGEGLLGSALSMGARGATEAAGIGFGQALSETALGDHNYNGEAIWAQTAKDALIGGAAGGVLGAGGYYLGRAADGLLAGARPGPRTNAVLDEIAEVGGAGRQLRAEAKEAEAFIENARKTGMTSEQAARAWDEVKDVAQNRAAGAAQATEVGAGAASAPGKEAGFFSGLVDSTATAYAKTGELEQQALRSRQYAVETEKLAQAEATKDVAAKKMSEAMTTVLRKGNATADEIHFGMKPQVIGKLVDKSRLDIQRDTAAAALQSLGDMLDLWEPTFLKGGAEGALRDIRKLHKEAAVSFARNFEGNAEHASRDIMLKLNAVKQELDSRAQWGVSHGFGEAVGRSGKALNDVSDKNTIRGMADRFRGILEDESVWGAEAAGAHREMNASFSNYKARTDHAVSSLGVSIDQQYGFKLPEGDFSKMRSLLDTVRGNDIDESLQAVKSIREMVAGQRSRYDTIEKYVEMTPVHAKNIAEARSALDTFESVFSDGRSEAAIVNRLKAQRLEEQGKGMGGLIGLAGDVFTRPLTTMDRLAQIRNTTEKLENSIAKGLEKFFGSDGKALADRLAPRAKDVIAKDIEQIRELASNPEAMQDRIGKMLGDLPKHAPKIAEQAGLTAQRALMFLANEAPKPAVPIGIIASHNLKGRYSDQQVSDWEEKRRAALDPESVVRDLMRMRLNRNAIRAIQFVSPTLFEKVRQMTIDHIQELEQSGKLDNMPYSQKAVISTLLGVPADRTWTTDFIATMQASKAQPVAPANTNGSA